MRIPSGKTDQKINFVALDANDGVTRKTGLSAFTVYRSRNGGAPVAMTSPTIAELSAANMPGVYALTLNEDTTIASSSDSEEMALHITQAGIVPVTRTIELYRNPVTTGRTLTVDANGRVDVSAVAGTAQTARDLGGQLDAAISSRAVPGSAMTLTSGERTAIANEVEAQIIDDTDSEKVLTAITDKIAAVNPSLSGLTLAAIASQVRTELTVELARIDATISSRLATSGYTAPDNLVIAAVKAKTDNLPVDPADASDIAASFATILAALGSPEGVSIAADIAALETAIGGITVDGDAVADALLDRSDAIEAGLTVRRSLRLISAVMGGKVTGAGSGTEMFRNAVADTKARVTATVDSRGNRAVVATDLS